jgi:histidinol dehydrogenase
MKIIKKSQPRSASDNRALRNTVSDIIDKICSGGDAALKKYVADFDGYTRNSFKLTKEEIDKAYAQITEQELADLKTAKANLEAFARAQKASLTEVTDFSPQPGIFLSDRIIPVNSCLCYVPGGRHPLYSSALMLITPARVAGVKRIAAASPADRETGEIHYKTVVAMDLAGADEIYACGGVQTIAAFSYGTEEITPVDLIVGPGNRYVAEAKRQCYGQVGIDFVAGPSEVLIIADETADPAVTAADMLAQAEHDPDAKAILLTTSEQFAAEVIEAVEAELRILAAPETARASWEAYGGIILLDDLEEAAAFANDMAPEHLEINIKNPDAILPDLVNYGSLFLGGNTAEVFGDYASGTNHTLPTVRAARYTGGVWAGTFLKVCTHQRMTPEASRKIAPVVSRMARGEGLEAHAIAAEKRLE